MSTRPLRAKSFGFTDHVYETSYIAVRCRPARMKTEFGRHVFKADRAQLLKELHDIPDGVRGRCSTIVGPRGCLILIWVDSADLGTLAHEAMHAVASVLVGRGLPLSIEADEAYAYYLGWLMTRLAPLLS